MVGVEGEAAAVGAAGVVAPDVVAVLDVVEVDAVEGDAAVAVDADGERLDFADMRKNYYCRAFL